MVRVRAFGRAEISEVQGRAVWERTGPPVWPTPWFADLPLMFVPPANAPPSSMHWSRARAPGHRQGHMHRHCPARPGVWRCACVRDRGEEIDHSAADQFF